MTTTLRDNSTAQAIQTFAQIVRERSSKAVGDVEEIRALIQKCKAANPPIYEDRRIGKYLAARARALSDLIDAYLVARVTARYPLLDPSLFQMKRWLCVSHDGKLVSDLTENPGRAGNGVSKCEVPLFASVPLFGDRAVELGKVVHREREGYGGTRTRTTAIKATLPVPPADIVKAGRMALGVYHTVIGEVYSDDVLCDLLRDKEIRSPELGVVWIPSPASLTVEVAETVQLPRHADPALTLDVAGNRFLVATYDIVDEEPIEHYLREFTVGEAARVIRRKKG